MPKPPVLILTALEMEARAIRAALGKAKSDSVSVQVIGMRAKRMLELPGKDEVSNIILAGLAGALDPSLKCGDLVAESAIEGIAQIRIGPIHTSEHPILSPAEKAELFKSTGALAVDMEGAIVRTVATARGIPLLHIRAISDAADESLDPAILGLVDEVGQPSLGAVASLPFRRPGLIPKLLRLRNQSNLALRELSGVLTRIVGAG